MRIALVMAASLIAVGCSDQRGAEGEQADTATNAQMAEANADGAFAEQPPAAQEFVQLQANSDMYEIAAGNLAAERAESDQAREFGRMMVADHTTSSQALKEAVAGSGQTLEIPTQLDAEHQAQIDMLRNLNGADFDREYMTQQMAAHRKALAMLKSYGGNGDTAELRQFAQQTIPVVQKHHDWLETNASATGVAMSPATATPTQ